MKNLLLGLACLTIFTGCGTPKEEEAMKTLADAYYEAHLKGSDSLTEAEITIADIKAMNENEALTQKYDLGEVSHCKDTTSVELTINQADKTITEYSYKLECE